MSQKFIYIITPTSDSTIATTIASSSGPSNTTDPIPVKIWLGIEKGVQFKENQQEGEELANHYIHATQGRYNLEDLMKTTNPEDERMLSWRAEWTQKLEQLRQYQEMP